MKIWSGCSHIHITRVVDEVIQKQKKFVSLTLHYAFRPFYKEKYTSCHNIWKTRFTAVFKCWFHILNEEPPLFCRKMMSKLPHLRQIYPFQFEDDYKLIYKDYLGECHTSDSWVVITRCILNLHSTKVI